MFWNGRNTQALRLQQFTRTISKFRYRAVVIRCKPSTKSTNAVSRINLATWGVFLDPVYQRMQTSTDQAIQNHVCWQGGIFTSGALESLSSLTGQQMKKTVQAVSSTNFFVFFSIFVFFGGSWHMLSDRCLRFSNILLKSVIRIF